MSSQSTWEKITQHWQYTEEQKANMERFKCNRAEPSTDYYSSTVTLSFTSPAIVTDMSYSYNVGGDGGVCVCEPFCH